MAWPMGCSDRGFERRRQPQHLRSGHAVGRHDVDDPQPAVRQRAGLVERDAAHRRELLEASAAFDQHALARRRRQRRHDRDRRGDHQRARTGDDQEHERAVDPLAPGPAERRAARQPRRGPRSSAPPACRCARSDRRTSGSARAAPARARRGGPRAQSSSRARAASPSTWSAPRPLMVPANTSAPGPFSTGSDSPVTGDSLT